MVASPIEPGTRLRLTSSLATGTAVICAYDLALFIAFVGDTGQPWPPTLFMVGYALAVVALAPASALAIFTGARFGVPAGIVYSVVGSAAGSTAAFLIARNLIRPAIVGRLPRQELIATLDRAVEKHGRILIALMRLSPVLPSNLLNYALGLTRVGFGDYLLGSLAMLPATLLWVSYGSLVGAMATVGREVSVFDGPGPRAFSLVSLVATLALAWGLTHLAGQGLHAGRARRRPSPIETQ